MLLQLTVLVIFGPRGLKGMQKHCIIEHFLRFVKQIRPKPSVVVTLHVDPALMKAKKKREQDSGVTEFYLSRLQH